MSEDTDIWRPFGMDEGERATAYDTLVEGVPPWMEVSISEWIRSRLTRVTRSTGYAQSNVTRLQVSAYRKLERVLRMPTGWSGGAHDYTAALNALWRAAGDRRLSVVDYLLAEEVGKLEDTAAVSLEQILSESGSAYRVALRSGKVGLLRRVPEGVQAAADHIMQSSTRAGDQLADAWNKAFGLHPDPSGAYRMSVKAVETAAIEVVSPRMEDATLGTVMGQMRADGDWRLPFLREHEATPTNELLMHMLRTLWRGQHDRHGGQSDLPPEVTQEEAEAAVAMSVSLIQWFSSGAVARR